MIDSIPPTMHTLRSRLAALLLPLALLAGCGDATTAPGATAPVLTLSTQAYDDTIGAPLDPLLLVALDDRGNPVSGRLATVVTDGPVLVRRGDMSTWVDSLVIRTDAAGRADVLLQPGPRAGRASIRIRPDGADSATVVEVNVRPGAPARFLLAPRDTALLASATLTIAAPVIDRGGDTLTVPVTWTSRRPDVASVDGSTRTVRGTAPGRVWIVANAGTAADSIAVSVVPNGVLAASGIGGIHLFRLDGAGYRSVPSAGLAFFDNIGLRWAPAGDRLVLHARATGTLPLRLFEVDTSGAVTPLDALPAGAGDVMQPQPATRDGYVYFVATSANERAEIWRVRWDGTGLERIGPAAGADLVRDLQPSPTSDGSAIAILSTRSVVDAIVLQVYHPGTGELVDLGLSALRPRWSPDDREIAFFVGRQLEVIRPDGSGWKAIGPQQSYDSDVGQIDWSPDGAWLVACVASADSSGRSLALISRATGEVVPLTFTAKDHLCEASWRPQ